VRFLTPTGNKRLNELVGFLCITMAVLIALALLSYSPKDAAFNVSAAPSDGSPARNWIGPAGAYAADLLFQIFGFAAFLLPAAILVLGWRWFRSRAIDSQVATVAGFGLLLLSLPTLLSLWHVWDVRGSIPPGDSPSNPALQVEVLRPLKAVTIAEWRLRHPSANSCRGACEKRTADHDGFGAGCRQRENVGRRPDTARC